MVKKERNQEIDIMKGLLTLAMILCHCLQFFGKEDAGIEKILVNVINLTTFSGFLFCFGFVCCLAYFQGDTKRGIAPASGSPENERLGGDRGSSGQPCELLYPL